MGEKWEEHKWDTLWELRDNGETTGQKLQIMVRRCKDSVRQVEDKWEIIGIKSDKSERVGGTRETTGSDWQTTEKRGDGGETSRTSE